MILEYRNPETVCGIVRNIGRDGETYEILSLEQLRDTQVDMFHDSIYRELKHDGTKRQNGNAERV